MPSIPLAGKRVVVTRSVEQAQATVSLLTGLGAEVILFPTIAFQLLHCDDVKQALARLNNYDWLIFSSANAVRFFCRLRHQYAPYTPLPRVAAVGQVTADLATEYGIPVDFVPTEFTGEALARELGNVQGQHILLPRSRIGRQQITALLRAQGALVDDIAIYDTVLPQPDPEAMKALASGFDIVLFASPSSVRNFLQLTADQPELRQHLQHALIASIGPVTARACTEAGLSVHICPTSYTLTDLIQAMIQHFNQPS